MSTAWQCARARAGSEPSQADHTIEGLAANGALHKVSRPDRKDVRMRLLPERHDHGGRGPAQGEAETDDKDIDEAITNICVAALPAGA